MDRLRRATILTGVLLASAPGSPFAQGSETSSAGVPLLWVPREEELVWEDFLSLMSDNTGLKLTVAVSSSSLPGDHREALQGLTDQGRVEFALRIERDPLLPALADLRAPWFGMPPSR